MFSICHRACVGASFDYAVVDLRKPPTGILFKNSGLAFHFGHALSRAFTFSLRHADHEPSSILLWAGPPWIPCEGHSVPKAGYGLPDFHEPH